MDEKKLVYGLGKQHKALVDIPKKDEAREHFKGLVIRKTGVVEVTDTHLLLRVPLNAVDLADLPATLEVKELAGDAWISADTVRQAFKNLNTKTAIEALRNIYVKNGKDLGLVSTDLDRTSETKENLTAAKTNLENFPVTDRILVLDENKVQNRITFTIAVLRKLISVVDSLSGDGERTVTLLLTGETSPVYLLYGMENGLKGLGIVMPAKATGTMAESAQEFKALVEASRAKETPVAAPNTLLPEGKAKVTAKREKKVEVAPPPPPEPELVVV